MVGIVVLAAGASQRLGRPKQLVKWDGETLLRRAVNTALDSGCGPVAVVLGHRAGEMMSQLVGLDAQAVICREWKDGMGRSLACGVEALTARLEVAGPQAVIIMTCDQPELNPEVLREMVEQWKTGHQVVACDYGEAVGVPGLFDGALFDDLMKLGGDRGAREILRRHRAPLGLVPFPGGSKDIDQPGDIA